MGQEEFLTTAELAQALKCSVGIIQYMARKGMIPYDRPTGRPKGNYLFTLSEVRRALRKRRPDRDKNVS